MTMDDVQFMDSFKRQEIQLTLKTTTIRGIVQRINQNKTVVLEDVVDIKNGRKFPGVKLFFGHEILNVEFPPAIKSGAADADRRAKSGYLTVAEFQPYRKSLILDDDDEHYVNFVVVDDFHEKFGPAVMHIRKQQVIGIGADGLGTFQHERLCWVQIATKTKVYLFDVLILGERAFKNGLSMILQSNHILKVTHDCRSIAGCLMAQFGVKLTNVFDTQVADAMCFYSETGGFLPDRVSSLQEVVSLHMKMPLSRLFSLDVKSQLTREDKEVWYVRPCPMSLLKVMALSVIHLQPLRLVLLDSLMDDYTALVDAYLEGSRQEPGHLGNIGTGDVWELPKELRELENMRQERQERAMDRYPVTQQGLLERFKPRPAPPAEGHARDADPRKQPDSTGPPATESPAPASGFGVDGVQPASIQRAPDPRSPPAPEAPEARPSLGKQLSTAGEVAPAGGPGLMEILMDTMGRGRPLPAGPSLGRGLSPQPPAHVPRENPGAVAMSPASAGRGEAARPSHPGSMPGPAQGAAPQQPATTTPGVGFPGLGRGLFTHNPPVLSFSSFKRI